jgi:hypothetical protein
MRMRRAFKKKRRDALKKKHGKMRAQRLLGVVETLPHIFV